MIRRIPTEQAWQAIEKELFAVIGMVTANQEARTMGVVYIVRDRNLYIGAFNRGKTTCLSNSQPPYRPYSTA